MCVDVTGTRRALGVARFGQHLDWKGLDDVERGGKEDCLVLSNIVLAAEDPVKKATGRKRMALVRSTLRCQILGSSSSPSDSSKRLEPNIEKAHKARAEYRESSHVVVFSRSAGVGSSAVIGGTWVL